MKAALLFGLMTVASANICADPDATRDEYIEGLCCSRECAGAVCSADTECVSGSCLEKCCSVLDVNCATCNDEGSCVSCKPDFSLLGAFHPDAGTFTIRDAELTGTANSDFGVAMSVSADGTIVAIGSPFYSNGIGRVQVYVWNPSTSKWEPRGLPIDGDTGERQGGELDLNDDGTVLALGNYRHSSSQGRVRVYDWSGSTWVPRVDIVGDKSYGYMGRGVSLSSDGSLLAVSEIQGWATYQNRGEVKVYKWSGSSWQQRGKTIGGHTSEHWFGLDLSINGDGTKLAIISGMYNSEYSYGDEGYVDGVYVYSWVNNDWGDLKKIEDLYYPTAVDLSTDGSTVIVGSEASSEHISGGGNAQIYEVKATGLVQRGSDLNDYVTQAQDTMIGSSVSVNADGSVVSVGAKGVNTYAGHLAVFDWTGTVWRTRQEFNGAAGANLGKSVSMSQDGSELAFSSNTDKVQIHGWDSECGASATACCLASS